MSFPLTLKLARFQKRKLKRQAASRGMWGHSRACMAPNTDSMPQQLTSLSSLRWRPSLLAENKQARCETHSVARRVGSPPRAASDEPNSSGGGLPSDSLSARCGPEEVHLLHCLLTGAVAVCSKDCTRLRFLAFRDSYRTRWEIQFIFTAFSCPVVGPVRRAD